MRGAVYGYVRASADSRDMERQMIALWDFGVVPENVFMEGQVCSAPVEGRTYSGSRGGQMYSVSGKRQRKSDEISGEMSIGSVPGSAYQKMLEELKENDTLVITSLDVLGNDCYELMDRWRYITIGKKAGIIVLELPLANTGIEDDVLGKVVARITLGVMQHFDQSRQYKRRRQAEGIARARQNGVSLGRKPKEIPQEFESVRLQWDRGEISARSAASLLGVDAGTFRKWVKAGSRNTKPEKGMESGRCGM